MLGGEVSGYRRGNEVTSDERSSKSTGRHSVLSISMPSLTGVMSQSEVEKQDAKRKENMVRDIVWKQQKMLFDSTIELSLGSKLARYVLDELAIGSHLLDPEEKAEYRRQVWEGKAGLAKACERAITKRRNNKKTDFMRQVQSKSSCCGRKTCEILYSPKLTQQLPLHEHMDVRDFVCLVLQKEKHPSRLCGGCTCYSSTTR